MLERLRPDRVNDRLSGIALRSAVWQVMNAMAGGIAVLITARSLGSEGNGKFSLLIALVSVSSILFNLSNTSIAHAIKCESSPAGAVAFASLLIGVFGFAFSYVFYCMVTGFFLSLKPTLFSYLFGLTAIPIILGDVYCNCLLATGRVGSFNVSNACRGISWLAGTLPLAVMNSPRSEDFLTAYAIASTVRCVAAARVFHRRTPFANAPISLYRMIICNGLKLHCSTIMNFLNYRLDLFILNSYGGLSQTGVYAFAAAVTERCGLPSQAIATTLLGNTAYRSHDKRVRQVLRGARYATALTLVLGVVCVILIHYSASMILGPSYCQTSIVIAMLLPGVTSLAISRCIAVDHLAVGDFNVSARAAGIGLITTIGADLLFIPKFGALGAALASSVAYAVAMMVHSIAFRRRYR